MTSFYQLGCRLLVGGLAMAAIAAPAWAQHVSQASRRGSATSPGSEELNGTWTYRSFRSQPEFSDPAAPLSELLFGQGELKLTVDAGGTLAGTIGGEGWELQLSGKREGTNPATLRLRGKGTVNGQEWIYDYLGFVVPMWPMAVDQRPAIVGSVMRVVPHGNAPAGYVAQWIAVKQEATSPAASPGRQELSQPVQAYRSELLERYREDSLREAARDLAPRPKPGPEGARNRLPANLLNNATGSANADLIVDYAVHRIGNDDVRLRTYNGQLAGPTLRAKAGDTLYITLRNRLPVEPSGPHGVNTHHEWNTTNLHFHGLHVAPQGTPAAESDNVLIEVRPSSDPGGTVQQYAVHIPPNHVAGTFWYHAHKHGAVAGQVASGMAGALIIERDDDQHNLDSVAEIAAAREEIMLLQQIPYLKPTGASLGTIERSPDGSGGNELAMLSPGAWGNLRRYVTVNGERIPTLSLAPGEVRRLRFIHSGQREEMRLQIVRAPGTAGPGDTFLRFHEIAVDGLPLGEIRSRDLLSLFPGYRSDALIQASADTAGEFHLVDTRAPNGTGADGSPEPLRLVARIVIDGPAKAMTLPANSDLQPHRLELIQPSAVTGTQHAFYGIASVNGAARFFISRDNLAPGEVPAGQEFDPTNYRPLNLNATERWIVGTRNSPGIGATHPFHIHTNPFYVEEVRNPAMQDVTQAELGGPTWRDTLAMKQGYTYKLLTRYDDFTGDFVNHCHILDHEDNGMMELVRIEGPSAPGNLIGAPNSRPRMRVNGASKANVVATLPAANGKPRIMLFVKGSFCPHCMQQLTTMSEALIDRNCEIFVVSASPESDFDRFPDLPYTLVADPRRKLFREFQVLEFGEDSHGTLVFDGSGTERLRRVGGEPFTDTGAILAALESNSPRVTFDVRRTSDTSDDYITWAPTECLARVVGGDPAGAALTVVLTNDSPVANPDGGNVLFASSIMPGQTATSPTLTISLSQDGSPTRFYIAGSKPGTLTAQSLASAGRDAFIEAHQTNDTGPLLGSQAVMVRVRKDASKLSALERSELLDAMATVKGSGMHEWLVNLHTIATGRDFGADWPDQAHGDAGFLPWHRAFLLQYERELQKTHPHVALHYWREDTPSTVFVPTFLGANAIGGGTDNVDFGPLADGNPLHGWSIDGVALFRAANDRSNLSWCRLENDVTTPTDYRSSGNNFSRGVENNPHNVGHGWVGGWMASCQTSPRDPVFFLFHCDIDRLWAQWQRRHNRFANDGADPKHYRPNDDFTTGSVTPLGHHLFDTMWPWDEVTGGGIAADPNDNRPPAGGPEAPFPVSSLPGVWPEAPARPTPAVMIDYFGLSDEALDLGFCYDDAPFGAATATPASPPGPAAPQLAVLLDPDQPEAQRMQAARELTAGGLKPEDRQQLLRSAADASQSDQLRSAMLRQAATAADDDQWIPAAVAILQDGENSGEQLREEIVSQFQARLFAARHHDATQPIHAALRQLVVPQESAAVRTAALQTLIAHGDDQAQELLRDALKNKDESIVTRASAARLLASGAPGQNYAALRPLLAANEPEPVRLAALLSLGSDAESSSLRQALALDRTQSPAVREAALRSLISGDANLPALALRMIRDDSETSSMKRAAAHAIGMYITFNASKLSSESMYATGRDLAQLPNNDPELQEVIARVVAKVNRLASRPR